MDLCSHWLLAGFGTSCLVTEEADGVGPPSLAAHSLSAKTDTVWAPIGARLPALMEAEQRGREGIKLDLSIKTFVSVVLRVYFCLGSVLYLYNMSDSGNESLINIIIIIFNIFLMSF